MNNLGGLSLFQEVRFIMTTIYVTTTIPYVNAPPHVGFALELVQADAIARYHRLIGSVVRLQTGTDENAFKNVLSARARGLPVETLVAENAARFRSLCEALGKTCVKVPDIPGFVVNRLLFPMLFDAVRLLDENDLQPGDVDCCMTLGAGHPMGPLALLDLVGLDFAIAIGETIGAEIPARVRELADAGALGRKTGRGFYPYAS